MPFSAPISCYCEEEDGIIIESSVLVDGQRLSFQSIYLLLLLFKKGRYTTYLNTVLRIVDKTPWDVHIFWSRPALIPSSPGDIIEWKDFIFNPPFVFSSMQNSISMLKIRNPRTHRYSMSRFLKSMPFWGTQNIWEFFCDVWKLAGIHQLFEPVTQIEIVRISSLKLWDKVPNCFQGTRAQGGGLKSYIPRKVGNRCLGKQNLIVSRYTDAQWLHEYIREQGFWEIKISKLQGKKGLNSHSSTEKATELPKYEDGYPALHTLRTPPLPLPSSTGYKF